MIRKAFVLGAGVGNRLRPLTEKRPKPTLPLMGRPFIEYVILHLKSAGIREILINTHHCANVYDEILGNGKELGVNISYSHEPQLLDTAGGLKNAESFFADEPLIVYNGDILSDGPLGDAIERHQRDHHLVTMILGKFGKNQNVAMDKNGNIRDLRGILGDRIHPLYTFSGIQIVEPEVFRFIPPGVAISFVDVYLDMIRSGCMIHGLVWKSGYWNDIGDLDSYRQAHVDLAEGTYQGPFPISRLGQDGSERRYFRFDSSNVHPSSRSTIVMRYGREKEENAYYIPINRFLKRLHIPVPEILYDDADSGTVLVQDLGDDHLCRFFGVKKRDEVLNKYFQVIHQMMALYSNGASLYHEQPFKICPSFTQKTYLWETAYFKENFLDAVAHLSWDDSTATQFENDRQHLASCLARLPRVLIHRDLQSKNIMIFQDEPFWIDFQGMRFGLCQYDLASLLLDPYVEFSQDEIMVLMNYFLDHSAGIHVVEYKSFLKVFRLAGMQRLMQALGAYGFLGLKKEKRHFLSYIEPALRRLHGLVLTQPSYKGIHRTCEKAMELLDSKAITLP